MLGRDSAAFLYTYAGMMIAVQECLYYNGRCIELWMTGSECI